MSKQPFSFKLPSLGEVFLLVFSLLIGFLLCELAANIWLYRLAAPEAIKKFGLYEEVEPTAWRIQPHHYLNYALTPHYQRDKLTHNSFGYRGSEIVLPKPDSLFRIVTIGGSTTYTEFVNDDQATYPALLAKHLRELWPGQSLEVVNAGVPGYNSWESLINLQFKVLDLAPDLLVIYHGTNDVHARLVAPDTYRGDNSGLRKQWSLPPVSVWDRSTVLRIIRRKLGWSQQVWLQDVVSHNIYPPQHELANLLEKNPPVYFDRNLRSMVGIARTHGVQTMLATWAHSKHFGDYATWDAYQTGYREHNEVIKTIGTELGVPVLDFAAAMPTDKEYWRDGRHVNAAGAAYKARLFATFIDANFSIAPPSE